MNLTGHYRLLDRELRDMARGLGMEDIYRLSHTGVIAEIRRRDPGQAGEG